jgi:hypothetical protein
MIAARKSRCSSACTACSVPRISVAFTTIPATNAASSSCGSNPTTRLNSATYGDAGCCAWTATIRRTASGTAIGSRSTSSCRTMDALFNARAVIVIRRFHHGAGPPRRFELDPDATSG